MTTLTDQTTEAGVVAALAERAADLTQLEGRDVFVGLVPNDSRLDKIDLTGPDFAPIPLRARDRVTVHDAPSLIAWLAKHGHDYSEVWADKISGEIVAVVNANGGANNSPGWGDHRATFRVVPTDAWKAWTELNGKWLSQVAFAEHIEDRLIDIVSPASADMLEIALTLIAKKDVAFESSDSLATGQRQFEYRETIAAKAGQKGRLEIPSEITLGVQPFEGAKAFEVTARFRYRISEGDLKLSFKLNRPEDVITAAFGSVVDEIQKAVDQPVFLGRP